MYSAWSVFFACFAPCTLLRWLCMADQRDIFRYTLFLLIFGDRQKKWSVCCMLAFFAVLARN